MTIDTIKGACSAVKNAGGVVILELQERPFEVFVYVEGPDGVPDMCARAAEPHRPEGVWFHFASTDVMGSDFDSIISETVEARLRKIQEERMKRNHPLRMIGRGILRSLDWWRERRQ